MAKILTVNRKKTKILTVNRKSHHAIETLLTLLLFYSFVLTHFFWGGGSPCNGTIISNTRERERVFHVVCQKTGRVLHHGFP